jgi:hypothetical protein
MVSAVEVWWSADRAESYALIESEDLRSTAVTIAGYECALEMTGDETRSSANVTWPPDVSRPGSIVRLATEPSAVLELASRLRVQPDVNQAVTSTLVELTGGALEVTVDDCGAAARIIAVGEQSRDVTGRDPLRRALQRAFDPSSLLQENRSYAISNGSSS